MHFVLIFAIEKQITKKDKDMKKSIFMVFDLINMMTRPAAEKVSNEMIFAEDLPKAVKRFLMNSFPGRSIAFARMITSTKGTMYVITLNDGIRIKINSKGNWEMVDCGMRTVPAALVPASVAAFTSACYPCVPISKIKKTASGYEIILSNHFKLNFNSMENVA